MSKPVLTLTTDFGVSDHFVGVMKGVILGIHPGAHIVDISHEVTPFSITQGAFLIAQAWRYFPENSVHLVVVDPGVGTARRPILIEAGGHRFVGPDNGVLSMVYSGVEHEAREITAEKYFLHPVSRTFHGRDIFAPIAAHLLRGVRAGSTGKLIDDHLKIDFHRPQQLGRRIWSGAVLHIDRFGNLITNFGINEFGELRTRAFELAVGTHRVHRLALTYAEVDAGELFAIVGSSSFVEIALRESSAARLLGCGPGAPVELTLY